METIKHNKNHAKLFVKFGQFDFPRNVVENRGSFNQGMIHFSYFAC